MLYGTAFDSLTKRPHRFSSPPAYIPGNRLSGLATIIPTLTNNWIVEPIYEQSIESIYGTISFSQIKTVDIVNALGGARVVSQTGDNLIGTLQKSGVQYVTLAGSIAGASVVLTINVTQTFGNATRPDTYTASLQAAQYTPPPPPTPMLAPGPTTSAPQDLTVTSAQSSSASSKYAFDPVVTTDAPPPTINAPPALDNGFSYVLPMGAIRGFYSIFNIPITQESRYTIFSNWLNTGQPGIGVSGNNAPGTSIAPSEQNDYWEVHEYQVYASPDVPYIVWQVDYRNLTKQGAVQSFTWQEDSGSGSFLGIQAGAWAGDVLRVTTDISTVGAGEIVHAVNPSAATKVDEVVGGGAIAVATAAVTGGASIGEIAAITAGAAGAVQGAIASSPTQAIEGAAITGAAVGIASDLVQAVTTADPVAQSVTSGDSGGESVLNPSGATDTLTATSPEAAPVVSSGPSTLLSTTGAVAEKATAATALSAGTTALTTEIKKLTNQLPAVTGGYTPGATTVAVVSPTTTAVPSSSLSPKTLLALGGVALLAIVKKTRA